MNISKLLIEVLNLFRHSPLEHSEPKYGKLGTVIIQDFFSVMVVHELKKIMNMICNYPFVR